MMLVDAAVGRTGLHVIASITSRQRPGRFFLHQLDCFCIPLVKLCRIVHIRYRLDRCVALHGTPNR
jgi:hypothetical protein